MIGISVGFAGDSLDGLVDDFTSVVVIGLEMGRFNFVVVGFCFGFEGYALERCRLDGFTTALVGACVFKAFGRLPTEGDNDGPLLGLSTSLGTGTERGS